MIKLIQDNFQEQREKTSSSSVRVSDVTAAAVVMVTGCVFSAAQFGSDGSLPVAMETQRQSGGQCGKADTFS